MNLFFALTLAVTLLSSSVLAHEAHEAEGTPAAKKSPSGSHRIIYDGVSFKPARLEIERGEEVTFVNRSESFLWPASNIHPTHEIYPDFDAQGPIEQNESWSFVFDRPGQWRFHNHLVPTEGGIIVVHGVDRTRDEVPGITREGRQEFEPMRLSTPEQMQGLFEDEEYLKRAVEKYGPSAVMAALSQSASETDRNCHDRAHIVGRHAYRLFGSSAFAMTSMNCESGSLHGATEAMLYERGTSDISGVMREVCVESLGTHGRNQCVHGIGHGIMAWTNYELHEALAICDQLDDPRYRSSDLFYCQSGVFMENVVGGLSGAMGHVTRFLSAEDPHYPCNILDKKYVASCYAYQTTHMRRLLPDVRDVAIACAEAPSYAQRRCYSSMGRDIAQVTKARRAAELAVEYCGYILAPDQEAECIASVERHWFWDSGEGLLGLKLCQTTSERSSKERCYEALFSQAKSLLGSEDMKLLCAGIEPGYHQRIPISELVSRLTTSINPFSNSPEPETVKTGFAECRRPFPRADKAVNWVLDWFHS